MGRIALTVVVLVMVLSGCARRDCISVTLPGVIPAQPGDAKDPLRAPVYPPEGDALLNYFLPEDVLQELPRDVPELSFVHAGYFSILLRSLGEPSLKEVDDERLEAYRVLFMPARWPNAIARVMRSPVRSTILVGKTKKRDRGRWVVGNEVTSRLTEAQWGAFLAKVEASRFWQQPSNVGRDPGRLDGTTMAIEGRRHGQHHVIWLFECDARDPLWDLSRHLLALSGIGPLCVERR